VKPSESDLHPETKSSSAIGPEVPLQAWERRVRQALHGDDKNALRVLFADLSSLVPAENVSHEWLRVVSGWDARAKTG
jgi:hypothetical protein